MGRYDTRRVQKLAANKLKKTLEEPACRAQETAFAAAHAGESDETLYDYVLTLKREAKNRLKATDVIGYCYLIERLGPWPGIMTRVNELLRAETENIEK